MTRAERERERYAARARLGLCRKCGAKRKGEPGVLCADCRETNRRRAEVRRQREKGDGDD